MIGGADETSSATRRDLRVKTTEPATQIAAKMMNGITSHHSDLPSSNQPGAFGSISQGRTWTMIGAIGLNDCASKSGFGISPIGMITGLV